MARTARRGAPPRPLVRLTLDALEDRLAPALFTMQAAQAPTGSNLNNNGCVAVGDLNKDGKPDAVLSNYGLDILPALAGTKISILYGNGASGYTSATSLSTGGKNISYVDLGDVNGDGWLDICAGNATLSGSQSDGSSVTILLNNQAGGFTIAPNSPFTTGMNNLSSVDLVDVNADGKLDVIATHFGFDNGTSVAGRGIKIYAGDGAGKFALLGSMDPTTNANLGDAFIPTNAQAADFTGDGIADIAASVPAVDLSGNNDPSIDGFVYIFAGTGSGAFTNNPTSFGSGGGLPIVLTIADVDGKNGPDIVIANAGDPTGTPEFKNSAIGVLLNNSTGSFSENALTTNERGTFSAAVADFNLDNKMDIAAANYGSQDGSVDAFVSVYYGNGVGGFVPASLDGSPFDTGYGDGGAQFVAVGDFDLNSTPDLIVAHAYNESLATKVVQLRNATPVLAASTTGVTVAPTPSYYGNSVTITATVTGGSGTPTGSVEFYDGAAPLGTVALTAGSASKDVTLTTAGAHSITAKYLGDTVYAISNGSKSHTVDPATTGITFTALPGTVTFGDTVTMSATVAAVLGTGTPAGSVSFYYNGSTFLGSQVLDGFGKASLPTTALPVGVNAVQAKYTATTNFAASSSSTVNVTVNAPAAVGTSTALVSSGSPSVVGTSVTFTATVTPASGTAVPTGFVSFFDGATQIGTAQALNAAGVAQVSTSALTLGDHTIQAKYAGVTGFSASDSNSLTQTVQNVPVATSTVSLSSGTNPSTFGNSVTFTAQVASTSGTPLGTVTFFADGTQIGQITIAAGAGSPQFYQLPYTGLAPGTRAITATYGGTTGINGSSSGTLNQLVNTVVTTVQIAGSGSPSFFTQGVTFTATVSGTPGTPTGQVEFFEGLQSLGKADLNPVLGQQKALLTLTDLAPGLHTVTAKYLGTTGFDPATSAGSVAQQVDSITTATGVQTNGSPAAFGSVVIFTATVTGTLGSPTGNVNFFADGTFIGTAPLTATTGSSAAASLPYGTLDVGSHSIKASYAGITGYNPSTSGTLNQTVSPIATTAAVQSASNPAFFGNGITFTATVTSGGGTPTGSVEFFDGTLSLGTQPLIPVSGVPTAELIFSTFTVGTHSVTAKYLATGTFGASTSDAVNQSVTAATTATGFVVTPTTGVPGDNITMTATVTVTAGAGTPTGTVNFYSAGAFIGSKAVDAAGVAVFSTTGLPLGANTVQAKYTGVTSYSASDSATETVTISAPPAVTTTTALAASVLLSTFGQPATFTATVAPGTAAGTVNFFDNGVQIGFAPLAGGVAVITVSDRVVGNHTIQAKFAGTAGFTASDSNSVAFGVDRGATTVTVTAPATTVEFGSPLAFTATVANAFGTPTGTVAFFDNGVEVGTAALAGGTATYPVGFGAGSHTVTAKYLGSTNYDISTSATYDLTVTPAATAVTIAASSKSVGFGSAVTFTASVVSPAGSPGGKVTFFDGATALGTVSIAGSPPVAVFTTSALGVGGHSVTAQYSGETNFAAGTSGNAGLAVTQLPTTVTVAAAPAKVAEGTPVALTATLAFPAGTPVPAGGTVTFFADGTSIGTGPLTGNTATLSTVLPVGTASITATYGGDSVYVAGTSAAVTATVTPTAQPLLTGFKEFGVGGGAGNGGLTRFFNPDGTERYSVDVFPGFTGGVRVTSADFNNDGIADLVAGTGPGRASRVTVYDGVNKAVLFTVDPFEATFTGGVYVATGDVTGDGVPDLVISPDEGGGPRVDIYAGAGFGKVISFFGIDDVNFRGGARAAVADVNGDGAGDLIVAAGFGGGPRVAGYSGPTLGSGKPKTVFPDFFSFEETLRNGVFITAGDLDGDGKAEVIAGGGPGGGPRITAFGAAQLLNAQFVPVANFFAGNTENRGGVRIVARNLDNDNRADLVVGDGTGAGSHVTGYVGKNLLGGAAPTPSFEFDAFPGSTNGVYVG